MSGNGLNDLARSKRWPRTNLVLLIAAIGVLASFAVWVWNRPAAGPATASGDATAATVAANAALAQSLPLGDQQDFEDARRGLIAAPTGKVLAADGSTVWDFDQFRFVEGNPPPTVNPSLWRHAKLNKQMGLFKVVNGIYQLRGFDNANLTLIEGKTGWIIVDPLTSRETANAAMAFARQHLGNKTVSAIVFTHSHIDHFGGVLGAISAEEVARRKLTVVAPEGFMEEATSENVLIGLAMGRRAIWQFGQRLPASAKGNVDSGNGNGVAFGETGILPPTVIVDRTPQEITLDGVRFVFQNVPASEAPAEMAFYLPDFNAYCGAEILNQTMHQILTLRGAKVRDALRWSGYIDDALARFGQAEVIFTTHNWPVWGNARVVDFMTKHRDTYKYIHDQTVRMINAGMKPHEIAEQIKLPASLEASFAVRGYYGTAHHNARAVYQNYIGWFDGNPANLDPLPRVDAAKRYVDVMGGAEPILKAARAAFEIGEYRWVAELLNHLVFAQPGNQTARELLARTYDQLGYGAESAIWRNWYLSGALELRTGESGFRIDPAKSIELLTWTPLEKFLVAMEGNLNGPAAEGKFFKINLVFSDLNESYVLWLQNSVLHHRKAPPAGDADASLEVTKRVFLKMMVGTAGIRDVVFGDEVKVTGSKLDLVRLLSLIDKPRPNFPIATP